MPRYLHSIDGALITGAFFILGISAYYIIKGIHLDIAKKSFKIALGFAFVTSLLQIPIGHYHAVQVAETQPVKLAAFEGLWETQSKAPILLFGIPNVKEERTDYAVEVPGLLSFLVNFDTETIIHGLKEFPKEDRPPIHATFITFHMMLALGGFFIGITALALAFRSKVFEQIWLMKIFLYTIPLPFIANQLGWMAAEIGRQPWIVYNLMRTRDAISPTVSAGEIIFSIIMFSCIYALLFGVWIFLLRHRIQEGPSPEYSKK
jgi:cytochrome d ubiquinol oxidase subunit I